MADFENNSSRLQINIHKLDFETIVFIMFLCFPNPCYTLYQ